MGATHLVETCGVDIKRAGDPRETDTPGEAKLRELIKSLQMHLEDKEREVYRLQEIIRGVKRETEAFVDPEQE